MERVVNCDSREFIFLMDFHVEGVDSSRAFQNRQKLLCYTLQSGNANLRVLIGEWRIDCLLTSKLFNYEIIKNLYRSLSFDCLFKLRINNTLVIQIYAPKKWKN